MESFETVGDQDDQILADARLADIDDSIKLLDQISGAEKIKSLRQKFNETQQQFAARLNISVETLRNWEQGKRKPRGPALELLRLTAQP